MCEVNLPAHCSGAVTSLASLWTQGERGALLASCSVLWPANPQHPVRLSVCPQGRPYL